MDLYIRTGTEMFMVNMHPTTVDFMQPHVFRSSDQLVDFMVLVTAGTAEAFTQRIEGYCISGIQGMLFIPL